LGARGRLPSSTGVRSAGPAAAYCTDFKRLTRRRCRAYRPHPSGRFPNNCRDVDETARRGAVTASGPANGRRVIEPTYAAGTPSLLRAINERSALEAIRRSGPVSRADLAREAGLRWQQVTQAAIGSPGVLDPERGAVALAANLPGWGRQGLVEALRRELGTNLSFENDVNLAAIGERARGHGRDVDSFVYLWVGTGVGMGLVLNGELYRGTHGAAGEIAYLPVGPGDPKDPVNRRRGTFEEAAAAAGIVRAAQDLGMLAPLTAKKIFAAARRGHPAAMAA